MSDVLKKIVFILLLTCFYSQSVQAEKSSRFDVIDFDFSLSCKNSPDLSDPQFPDSNVSNKDTVKGGFVEGEYGGSRPIDNLEENVINTYFAFDYFGAPVSNYTSITGVDGGNHPPPSFDIDNLTVDLSSLYLYFNGSEYHVGQSDLLMVEVQNNRYSVDFLSQLIGQPFDTCTARLQLMLKHKGHRANNIAHKKGV